MRYTCTTLFNLHGDTSLMVFLFMLRDKFSLLKWAYPMRWFSVWSNLQVSIKNKDASSIVAFICVYQFIGVSLQPYPVVVQWMNSTLLQTTLLWLVWPTCLVKLGAIVVTYFRMGRLMNPIFVRIAFGRRWYWHANVIIWVFFFTFWVKIKAPLKSV